MKVLPFILTLSRVKEPFLGIKPPKSVKKRGSEFKNKDCITGKYKSQRGMQHLPF